MPLQAGRGFRWNRDGTGEPVGGDCGAPVPHRRRRDLSAPLPRFRTRRREPVTVGGTVAARRATDGTGTRGRRTLARTRPESGNGTAGGCRPVCGDCGAPLPVGGTANPSAFRTVGGVTCPHLSAAFPKRTRRGCPCPSAVARDLSPNLSPFRTVGGTRDAAHTCAANLSPSEPLQRDAPRGAQERETAHPCPHPSRIGKRHKRK